MVAAASAAAVAAFHFAGKMAEQGDEIAKTSRELGIASDQLQVLRFAAERTGIGVDRMNQALRDGQKRLTEVARGTGLGAESYKKLGISIVDANGKMRNIDELIPEIADKIRAFSSESERAGVLAGIFGEEAGPRMGNLLMEGSQGIENYRKELEAYGAIISEDALAQSEAFQDNLLNLQMVFAGLGAVVGAELLPVFNELMLLAKDIILQNKDLINEKLTAFVRKVLDVTVTLVEYAVDMLPIVYKAIETIYTIIKTVINALGGMDAVIEMIGSIIALVTAVVVIVGVLNASTALLVAAAVAGAAVAKLAIDSLFKAIGKWFTDLIKKTPDALKGMFEWIKNGVKGLVDNITSLIPQWIKDLLQGKLKLPSLKGLLNLPQAPPKPTSSGSSGARPSIASTANVNQTLNFGGVSSPQQVASATGGATRTAVASAMNPLDLAAVGA